LAVEDDECSLGGVVSVGRVRKDGPTRGGHERPVPADDGLERGRVAMADERTEQVSVGRGRGGPAGGRGPVGPAWRCRGAVGHRWPFGGGDGFLMMRDAAGGGT